MLEAEPLSEIRGVINPALNFKTLFSHFCENIQYMYITLRHRSAHFLTVQENNNNNNNNINIIN